LLLIHALKPNWLENHWFKSELRSSEALVFICALLTAQLVGYMQQNVYSKNLRSCCLVIVQLHTVYNIQIGPTNMDLNQITIEPGLYIFSSCNCSHHHPSNTDICLSILNGNLYTVIYSLTYVFMFSATLAVLVVVIYIHSLLVNGYAQCIVVVPKQTMAWIAHLCKYIATEKEWPLSQGNLDIGSSPAIYAP